MKFWNWVLSLGITLRFIVKYQDIEKAREVFYGTGIKTTAAGWRESVSVIGKFENKNQFVNKKLGQWCKEIKILSNITATESHAAYGWFHILILVQENSPKYLKKSNATGQEHQKTIPKIFV